MTITNHILAGAIIGIAVKEPVMALSLALLSHFVMDALPHYGYAGHKGYGEALRHKIFYKVGVISAITTIAVVVLLACKMQWLALAAGLVAACPDLLGIYNYRKYEKHGLKAHGILKVIHVKFHRAIQWCERPWGIYIEAGVFFALGVVLLMII